MHIELRKAGDVVIVDLKGKLSAGLGDQILRETIDELLGESWKKILLNLSEVSFMDSAGLGELVAGLKTARNLGATLKILNRASACRSRSTSPACCPCSTSTRTSRPRWRVSASHSSGARLTLMESFPVTFSSIEHSGQLMLSPTSSS